MDLIECKELVTRYHKQRKLPKPIFPALEDCDEEYHQRYSFDVDEITDFDAGNLSIFLKFNFQFNLSLIFQI